MEINADLDMRQPGKTRDVVPRKGGAEGVDNLRGKGFFIIDSSRCEGGDPIAMLAAAQAAGLSHVLVKIAEGTKATGMDADGRDFDLPIVQVLRAGGLAVWGWHILLGEDPAAEAALAVCRVHELAQDGYVFFANESYELPGREPVARKFMTKLRAGLGDLPIALSSFRFPNYHPAFPWAAFLEKCDAVMPQVYWEAAHDSGAQLEESLRQHRALPNARMYIPTGAAYIKPNGWAPTREDIHGFIAVAKEQGVEALNFFSWDDCREHLPDLWEQIANLDWPLKKLYSTPQSPEYPPSPALDFPPAGGGQPPSFASQVEAIKARVAFQPTEPDKFTARYLKALNSNQAAEMASLYAVDAVHIRGDKVLRGTQVIRSGYSAFFFGLPEGSTVELLGMEGYGDVRYLAWKAGPLAAYESIILREGLIILEYSFIG